MPLAFDSDQLEDSSTHCESQACLASFAPKGLGKRCQLCLPRRRNLGGHPRTEFEFAVHGNEISGYTVEIFLQRNGNLSERELRPDQW